MPPSSTFPSFASAPPLDREAAPADDTRRVLLVDDHRLLLETNADFLRDAGYDVVTALDGEEATRCLQRQRFDVVVTDILLPGKDGIEIIIGLQRSRPKVKVIAISAGGMLRASSHLTVAQRIGANQTLAKPFSPEDLLQAIKQVLATPVAPGQSGFR
jgi:DNA-binding response OmpR family regulator